MRAATALAPEVRHPGLSIVELPEGSYVMRATSGEWLERSFPKSRYWVVVAEAREVAKGFTQIHSGVRVHLYVVRSNFPWWVETWLYGIRTVPIDRG